MARKFLLVFLALGILNSMSLTGSAEEKYILIDTMINFNFNPGGFAMDPAGNFYVTDWFGCRILKYDANGQFLKEWGQKGTANGSFDRPSKIALDSDGNVYVVDTWNGRIQRFDSDGTWKNTWTKAGSESFGTPTYVAVDSAHAIYAGGSKVLKFKPDGTLLKKYGASGSPYQPGDIILAQSVVLDLNDNLYVGHYRFKNYITKFKAFFGTVESEWEFESSPEAIALDLTDNIYATDGLYIYKLGPDGKLITKWGEGRTQPVMTDVYVDITVDPTGFVYVLKSGGQLLKYGRMKKIMRAPINRIRILR